jgi:putative SOS response-associated peptidase YedK
MFGKAFAQRRCLILGDGVIEWKTEGKRKLPHLFAFKNDEPFAFAGIWNRTRLDGVDVESCALLTTEANALFADIGHERMPVLLKPEQAGTWLDPSITTAEPLRPLFAPTPPAEMTVRQISTKVNNVRYKDPDCLASAESEHAERSTAEESPGLFS